LLTQLAHLLVAGLAGRRAVGRHHALGQLPLLAGELLGASERISGALSALGGLLLLKELLRLLQPLEALLGGSRAGGPAVGG
jgi:hypothetical protein